MTTRSLHAFLQQLRRSLHPSSDVVLSDAQLLERWTAHRDRAAFELLLWRHGAMVVNTCRRLLRRGEDVEDTFQATFLVLVRKAGSIRRGESLAAWLHRVASRLALRTRTANARRAAREQPLVETPTVADSEESASRDLRAIIDEEIDRLPASYRRAVILCCLQGKSQEEAARLLACPRGTVSSWLTRGRQRLRQRLLRRGVDLSLAGLTAALAPDASAAFLAPLVAPLLGVVAAGGAVPVGMLSAQTIALAEGMLRTMLMTKMKIAAAVFLVGALFASGIGTLSHSTQAADPRKEPRESKKAAKNLRFRSRDEKGNDWDIELRMPRHDRIAWGKAAHGLQAGIAFRRGDQENYRVGESVTFVVYLRNISDKKIRLRHIEPLFAEFMPAVEDDDGKRIGVAAGPANLGRVPILHRTLEPGERITLGYPWFRIRPVDWRGEILGPTCCATPGQYKIGYVGFPLRLNDDKSDVSGPGTGQVELDIRKSDAPGEKRPAKNTLDCLMLEKVKEPAFKAEGMSASGDGRAEPANFLKSRDLKMGIRIEPKRRRSLRKLSLLASRDNGATFLIIGHAYPDAKDFHVHLPGDGVYYFIVQEEDADGRLTPRDPARVRPSWIVCVDTKPPVVKLEAERHGKDSILLRWDIRDENLDLSSMLSVYSAVGEKGWTSLPIQAAPNGRHIWTSPPQHARVRLRVRDKAGNESRAELTIHPE